MGQYMSTCNLLEEPSAIIENALGLNLTLTLYAMLIKRFGWILFG